MEALSVSHQSFEVACSTISSSIHEESLWSRPKSRGSAGRVPEARSPGVACVQTTPPLKSPFSDCFLRGGGGVCTRAIQEERSGRHMHYVSCFGCKGFSQLRILGFSALLKNQRILFPL